MGLSLSMQENRMQKLTVDLGHSLKGPLGRGWEHPVGAAQGPCSTWLPMNPTILPHPSNPTQLPPGRQNPTHIHTAHLHSTASGASRAFTGLRNYNRGSVKNTEKPWWFQKANHPWCGQNQRLLPEFSPEKRTRST